MFNKALNRYNNGSLIATDTLIPDALLAPDDVFVIGNPFGDSVNQSSLHFGTPFSFFDLLRNNRLDRFLAFFSSSPNQDRTAFSTSAFTSCFSDM